MLIIKNDYTDIKGNEYNIRNLHLEKKEDLIGSFGNFITETKRGINDFRTIDEELIEGVYLYKSKDDPKKAIRLYKDWADYKYIYHDDHRIVSALQEKQKDIKLTDFPTGIITLEDSVIGQEIIFYEGYKTLKEEINNLKDLKRLIYYYQKMIVILQELLNENIIYSDVHANNFMIRDKSIKLIDFESSYVKFENSKYYYENMINNLKDTINYINEKLSVDFKITNSNTLEELKEEIIIKSKKIL